MFSSSCSFTLHTSANQDAMFPAPCFVHQRNSFRSSATKQNRRNWHSIRMLPIRINYGTLASWRAKSAKTTIDRHDGGDRQCILYFFLGMLNFTFSLHYRELACAAFVLLWPSTQQSPCQSVISTSFSISFSMPSQNTPPSLVYATLVNIVFSNMVCMAMGLLSVEVPGATPKNPFSGFIALNSPLELNFIQAMSSPTHSHL